jgi:hypothetical protein
LGAVSDVFNTEEFLEQSSLFLSPLNVPLSKIITSF